MIATRPCSCDRFSPGRPYRAGRDCADCWMYAHRPTVRRAWGGDPDECQNFLKARPEMPAVELAELLNGPLVVMPEGWRHWPVTREAHRLLVERFLAEMPSYPEGRFSNRGAVICGGGRYEASAYVACRMLRHVGWPHPIQVWHRGAAEPISDRIRTIPGVVVVDAESHPARDSRRIMGGWESKSFAILNCPFEEVLFLDADCYPIYNPDECFDSPHNPCGIVTWPDFPGADSNVQWDSYCLQPDSESGINGGHYVLTKRKAWPVFQLAQHYDDHSDYYYCQSPGDVGGLGDQDQVRVALHKLGIPCHRYTDRPLVFADCVFLQAGPNARPLFVHRIRGKFAPPGAFPQAASWLPTELPMEATAWRFFTEWMTESVGDMGQPGDEVPGWFRRDECELWQRLCRGRDVLELGRHNGRSTLAAALSARSVVSIDRTSAGPADLWLQRYGVRHKVWLREGEFADLVSVSGGPFSACLIDGTHDRWNVERDIAAASPLLAPGAVVGFHDYDDPAFPDVRLVADETVKQLGWRQIDRSGFLVVLVTPERSGTERKEP